MLQNTNNLQTIPRRGGGGYKPHNQNVIRIQVQDYARRYWKRELRDATALQKQVVTFTLEYYHGFSRKFIGQILEVHKSTVSRYYNIGYFFYFRQSQFRKDVEHLQDYILYNAKYISK